MQATTRAEGQLLGASSNFREQLERIRTGLQGQIDDINRGLMQITAQLERTGNTLRATTVGTVADVERISQRFDQTSKEASTQLVDKTARMRGATEEVANLLSGFGDQLDTLLDRLSMAGDGIRRHEGDLVGQMQTALSHPQHRRRTASKPAARLRQPTSANKRSNVSTTSPRPSSNRCKPLPAGSQTAAGIMRGIGHIYGDQSQALNKNVGEAHEQVQGMNKSIDEMQQRTDRMRVSLKLQGEELMGSAAKDPDATELDGRYALTDTVDEVLEKQAAESMKKIG